MVSQVFAKRNTERSVIFFVGGEGVAPIQKTRPAGPRARIVSVCQALQLQAALSSVGAAVRGQAPHLAAEVPGEAERRSPKDEKSGPGSSKDPCFLFGAFLRNLVF